MKRIAAGLALAALTLAAAAGAAPRRVSKQPAIAFLPLPAPSPTLSRFGSEGEFRSYLRSVRRVVRARNLWWAADSRPVQLAQATPAANTATDAPPPPVCLPEVKDCRSLADERIVVTGSRIPPHNASITNNQTIGVDEGDIVKQAGRFLLILQDGRLFAVDTKPAGAAGLAVTDRMNVYRDPREDTWYDEMLVYGDRVVITGYSYEARASEVSVIRIGADGRFMSLGTFFISSDDYYSSDNYATRLVGENLVVYAPLDLDGVDPDKPFVWPVVRRWMAGEDRAAALRAGRNLLDARNVYRPVTETFHPVVHTLSICPLGAIEAGRDMRCRATGFIASGGREFYVAPDAAYLWTVTDGYDGEAFERDPRCPARFAGKVPQAAVFELPLNGDEPGVLLARGAPNDHFALETGGQSLRAFLRLPTFRCLKPSAEEGDEESRDPATIALGFFSAALERFDTTASEVPSLLYTPLPSPGAAYIADRFTDSYLVYGGMGEHGSYPPQPEDKPAPGKAFAVPVDHPASVRPLPVSHTIIRAERAGNDIVLTGYRDPSGLDISFVDLKRTPHIGSTAHLQGRYESEGRSHAFNSLLGDDGAGLMGLPTVRLEADSDRWSWWSGPSDVSFLSVDAEGRLASAGELVTGIKPKRGEYGIEDQEIPGYSCEVSCIDWYGNSRPIFTDGRVFALTGAELIEGRLEEGKIREVRRLQVAGPSRPRAP